MVSHKERDTHTHKTGVTQFCTRCKVSGESQLGLYFIRMQTRNSWLKFQQLFYKLCSAFWKVSLLYEVHVLLPSVSFGGAGLKRVLHSFWMTQVTLDLENDWPHLPLCHCTVQVMQSVLVNETLNVLETENEIVKESAICGPFHVLSHVFPADCPGHGDALVSGSET